jgi:type 1 glutamine amidotransferase
MLKKIIFLLLTMASISAQSQSLEAPKIDEEFLAKIESLAPAKAKIQAPKRKLLVYSQHTGFYHWTIPHNDELLKIMAKKSGAFEVHIAHDIDSFEKKNLKQYDAVIFNNCNPSGPKRDLFYDLLKMRSSLSENEIEAKAKVYQQNFMDYIAKGGGLFIMHGAITVQNNDKEFSRLTGGSFDYHPKQQTIHLKEVDKNHPLVAAFHGNGFTHVDEPYFFNNAYSEHNFRPLLYMESKDIAGKRDQAHDDIVYQAWVKRHGKGRVLYSSMSHNIQSAYQAELMEFFLDGIQYVTGDLKCDDSAMGK